MIKFYRITVAIFFGLFLSIFCYWHFFAQSAPLLANYFLNQIPSDQSSLNILAKNNILIISPEQVITHKSELDYIKSKNSKIVILAYVPSQSYNTRYWPNDIIYKNLFIKDSWWLKNSSGNVVEKWSGLKQTNMNSEWSEYLVNFSNQYITNLSDIDGIFFDMVSDGISWSGGDIDLNNDGVVDEKSVADKMWTDRVEYFLRFAKTNLRTKYIVINGSSNPRFQPYVNGRMFESFPASWDWGGNWATIMNFLVKGKEQNAEPKMMIINSGTNNTGNDKNYQAMRFGLTSSMLEDNVYYSFDYGEENHGQNWQYDEYDVNLGSAVSDSQSLSGKQIYSNEVWRRDYAQGVVLVNPTNATQKVDLGAEYENILGKQDSTTNNGKITSKINLSAKDGLLMLKTTQSIAGAVFGNGNFVRFFDAHGGRVRNGFFAFVPGVVGGARVYLGDLDNNGEVEKIMTNARRLEIFNAFGQHWFDGYPFGGDYGGEMRLVIGKIKSGEAKILIAPSSGGYGVFYDYYGAIIKEKFYPFGVKYRGGFYGAIGDVDGDGILDAVVGTDGNRVGEVLIFDNTLQKIKSRFYPFDKKYLGRIKVAIGDVNGDGQGEIITLGKFGIKNTARIFNFKRQKISEFSVNSALGGGDMNVSVADVNFDGKDEVVIEGN